jgi:hypothetical protein
MSAACETQGCGGPRGTGADHVDVRDLHPAD